MARRNSTTLTPEQRAIEKKIIAAEKILMAKGMNAFGSDPTLIQQAAIDRMIARATGKSVREVISERRARERGESRPTLDPRTGLPPKPRSKKQVMAALGRARNATPKALAFSKSRFRASPAERRQYGGSTITEFYVMFATDEKDASKWEVITGHGKSPADRKRDAIEKFLRKKAHGGASRNSASTSKVIAAAAETIREVAAINYRDGMGLEKRPELTLKRLRRFPIEHDVMALGINDAIAIYNKEMRRLLRHGAENRRASAAGERNSSLGSRLKSAAAKARAAIAPKSKSKKTKAPSARSEKERELLRLAEAGESLDGDELCGLVRRGYVNQAKATKLSDDAYTALEQRNEARRHFSSEATIKKVKSDIPGTPFLYEVWWKGKRHMRDFDLSRAKALKAKLDRHAAPSKPGPTRNLSRFTNARSKAWGD